ncbi:hypothetical protein [uncultured Legionella sp.]|uniref:hypothetical protein n=1 Tax=uncultured Legionella sp. TaxID=210934 RepID=UPI0026259F4F|nr:hypothetical protein [uncultured Legionella sp.]
MEHKFCASIPSISEEQRQFFLDDFLSGFNKLKENALQTAISSSMAPPTEIKTSESGQQNKHAALNSYEVAVVKRKARNVTSRHEFSSDEKNLEHDPVLQ